MSKKKSTEKSEVKGVKGTANRSASAGRFVTKNYAKALSYIVRSEDKEIGLMIASSKS